VDTLKHRQGLLLILGVCLHSGMVLAETPSAKTKPSTALSTAADAANAAVNAANAAANAANAAAAAANAAANAINAVLPTSQQVAPANRVLPTPVDTNLTTDKGSITNTEKSEAQLKKSIDLPLDDFSTTKTDIATTTDDADSLFSGGRFSVPSEKSLIGLVGTYEIPVEADVKGDFATGIANVQSEGSVNVEPISSINLSDAVKASLGFSRDVLIASSRVDQAKAQTGQAKAFLLPSLLLNIKTGREISEPGSQIDPVTGREVSRSNHDRSDANLTLKQPLLDLPSLYDWKRRKVVEQSRSEGMRSSQGDAYLATVNAYLNLASSRLQANMAKEYEAQLTELFGYVTKRASAGAASNSDKERVRARALNAKSSRIEQEAAHAAAGVELVRLMNLAPGVIRLPDLEDVGVSVVPQDLGQAMPMAIASNPDIGVLQAELKAAEIDQKAAKGRYIPRLDLEYSNSDSVHAGGAVGDQHDQRLMLVMNWAIFNGGGDLKYNQEKASRYEEVKYRLDNQRRIVVQSLTAQYATLESTRSRIAAGYRELESISVAAKAMSKKMISGNQSLLDMLDVYDRYYQSRTRLVTLHTQEMNAVAQIARLVQGVPSQDKTAINTFDSIDGKGN
jgi:adhesin transport system outer membrane protein